MAKKYKSVGYSGEWHASTFGCGCCSDTKHVADKDAEATLRQIASMYQEMAARYEKMADLTARYDIPASYRRVTAVIQAQRDLHAASQHLAGKNAGHYGAEMAQRGLDTLTAALLAADEALWPKDNEIATTFGWW